MQERIGNLGQFDKSSLHHFIPGRDIFEELPSRVADKETLSLVQIRELHNAVDYTTTHLGSTTLFRSLMQPLTDSREIHAKQQSVKELTHNTDLYSAAKTFLEKFARGEKAFLNLLNGRLDGDFYKNLRTALTTGAKIGENGKQIPDADSTYLNDLIHTIQKFDDTRAQRLMRGPIYKTRRGPRPREDTTFFTYKRKFRTSPYTPGTLIPMGMPAALIPAGLITHNPGLATAGGYATFGIFYGFINTIDTKPRRDRNFINNQVSPEIVADETTLKAVEAIGRLDELMSFVDYQNVSYDTTIPDITNGIRHEFYAKNLRNPVIGKKIPNHTPNDINLTDYHLTFFTGPNSGGKTTVSKSIFQNQLLAQIGSPIAASNARLTVAETLAYQSQTADTLTDEEGRFGTELTRTCEIFRRANPNSLVVLDELAQGTTYEEGMRISTAVMEGFQAIGGSTILVTHNHELVRRFQERNIGQALQVEFDDDKPTYRLTPGISTDSHALRVAKKLGMAPEDIEEYLKTQGYLP